MYAIMGISGRVGSAVAQTILAAGQPVRAIVRNRGKGTRWQEMGCEVKLADVDHPHTLTAAFEAAQGAFVMLPPAFDQPTGLAEGHARANALYEAILAAQPAKVVVLSTYGAQVERPNLFNELGYLEQVIKRLELPVTILRAAWYMENHEWDAPTARANGVIHSHLQPLDQAIPMVSTRDVGRMAAQLLMEAWNGLRIVEFEGPEPVSPNRLAAAFEHGLHKPVHAVAVPHERWASGFQSFGITHPEAWMQSLDGTNEGWLAFEGAPDTRRRGQITIDEAIASILLAGH